MWMFRSSDAVSVLLSLHLEKCLPVVEFDTFPIIVPNAPVLKYSDKKFIPDASPVLFRGPDRSYGLQFVDPFNSSFDKLL